MLRPATPADRPDLIALALAEDAAWSDSPAVSAEEAGEFVDGCRPGVIFERDGRVAGYAAAGDGSESIVLVDPESRGWRRTIGLYRDVGFEVDREWRVYSRSTS